MNRFVDQGVLGFRDGTGKGGHHRIYYPLMDEKGYKKYIIKTMVESFMRDFPSATRERRSISFDPELLGWVDEKVAEDYHFKDRSHFIEVLIREYKAKIEKA